MAPVAIVGTEGEDGCGEEPSLWPRAGLSGRYAETSPEIPSVAPAAHAKDRSRDLLGRHAPSDRSCYQVEPLPGDVATTRCDNTRCDTKRCDTKRCDTKRCATK